MINMDINIGDKFNRWTVFSKSKRSGYWLCKCECGTDKEVRKDHLLKSSSKSCGCYRDEKAKTQNKPVHGHSTLKGNTAEYNCWSNMIQRCTNSNSKVFHHYGGRGIQVCDRWKKFSNFIEDIGLKPSNKHTLERINNDGNYEPSNCKWATMNEQNRNKRLSRRNTTSVTGVNWKKRIGKYHARIGHMGEQMHLGSFDTLEDAIQARKEAEIFYWGKSSI